MPEINIEVSDHGAGILKACILEGIRREHISITNSLNKEVSDQLKSNLDIEVLKDITSNFEGLYAELDKVQRAVMLTFDDLSDDLMGLHHGENK